MPEMKKQESRDYDERGIIIIPIKEIENKFIVLGSYNSIPKYRIT